MWCERGCVQCSCVVWRKPHDPLMTECHVTRTSSGQLFSSLSAASCLWSWWYVSTQHETNSQKKKTIFVWFNERFGHGFGALDSIGMPPPPLLFLTPPLSHFCDKLWNIHVPWRLTSYLNVHKAIHRLLYTLVIPYLKEIGCVSHDKQREGNSMLCSKQPRPLWFSNYT